MILITTFYSKLILQAKPLFVFKMEHLIFLEHFNFLIHKEKEMCIVLQFMTFKPHKGKTFIWHWEEKKNYHSFFFSVLFLFVWNLSLLKENGERWYQYCDSSGIASWENRFIPTNG